MLLKMGWSEGKGLGKKEDGISSHLRVKRKTESLGIGCERDLEGNGAFSSQIVGFNALLAELNEEEETCKVEKKRKKRRKGSEQVKLKKVKKLKKKPKSERKVVKMKQIKRKHAKVLKAKDVSSYSSTDLKAILGGM